MSEPMMTLPEVLAQAAEGHARLVKAGLVPKRVRWCVVHNCVQHWQGECWAASWLKGKAGEAGEERKCRIVWADLTVVVEAK